MDAHRIPFTEDDERRIASAATWGMIVAITSLCTGVITLVVQGRVLLSTPMLMQIVGPWALTPMVVAAITVITNVWLLQASLAFRKVALTDEADQAHLLAGFRNLRAYFMVQVLMILLSIGGVLLAGMYFTSALR